LLEKKKIKRLERGKPRKRDGGKGEEIKRKEEKKKGDVPPYQTRINKEG
jgi:hypothetical protein